jgi:hypothetical protein
MAAPFINSRLSERSEPSELDAEWNSDLIAQFVDDNRSQSYHHLAALRRNTAVQWNATARSTDEDRATYARPINQSIVPVRLGRSAVAHDESGSRLEDSRLRHRESMGRSLGPPMAIYSDDIVVSIEITVEDNNYFGRAANAVAGLQGVQERHISQRANSDGTTFMTELRKHPHRLLSSGPPCPIPHVRRRTIDEDCSICAISLATTPVESLVWCKGACGHNFHKACFEQWRAYSVRPLRCVYWYVNIVPVIL